MASTLTVDNIVGRATSTDVHIPGHVLQFKYDSSFTTTTITTNVNSNGWVDIPVSVTITPLNTSSKMYIRLDMIGGNITAGLGIDLRILRDSTVLQHRTNVHHRADGTVSQPNTSSHVFAYEDTPSTTSSIVYKFQIAFRGTNTGQFTINDASSGTGGASPGGTTITVMEIGQ